MDVLNYEKVLSIVMAMLVSCFAISTGAMAAVIPTIKDGGESVPVTYPKNGLDEKSVKIANSFPKQRAGMNLSATRSIQILLHLLKISPRCIRS